MDPQRPKAKKKREGPGRPPIAKAKLRGKMMTLRLTSTETSQLQRLADEWGVSAGEALRRCFAKVANQDKE